AQDPGQEPRLLLGGAVRDERRRQQVLTHVVDASRGFRARVLLGPDDLLVERRAATTRFDRPAEPDEPRVPELALPRHAHVEADVLVTRAAASLQLRVLTDDVLGEPGGGVASEALVVVGELDVDHLQEGSAMSSTRTPSGSARNSRSMPGLARVSSITVAPQ